MVYTVELRNSDFDEEGCRETCKHMGVEAPSEKKLKEMFPDLSDTIKDIHYIMTDIDEDLF